LLRCYTIPVGGGKRVWFEAEDLRGRSASVEVTDLRLFLFANGIGILSLGVEAFHLSAAQALWINESLRKVYPSSGRQIREGRIPKRMSLFLERSIRNPSTNNSRRTPMSTGVSESAHRARVERAALTARVTNTRRAMPHLAESHTILPPSPCSGLWSPVERLQVPSA
jgi:hypothetical protein